MRIIYAAALLLLVPAYAASAQSPGIVMLDNFGEHDRGDVLFLFGSVAQVEPDSYLVLQVINPGGHICQIQQLSPLSGGMFLTEHIPLKGRICGVTGEYEVRVFYGDRSAASVFSVGPGTALEPSDSEYVERGIGLLNDKIGSIQQKTGSAMEAYTQRLTDTIGSSEEIVGSIEAIYTDLWVDFLIEDEFYDLDPTFRPAVESALAATARLVEDGELDLDDALAMDRQTYAAAFYYEIGDRHAAIERLNDVFVSVRNADPVKPERKQLTYAELEQSVLNLMTKPSVVLSKPVKTELAFIFARGTAPLHAEDLDGMIDLLTKARYLDVVSRKDSSLYSLVQTEWESAKISLSYEGSIESLLEESERVDRLHRAALLLHDLDSVERFMSRDAEENPELINMITPDWNALTDTLNRAASPGDIIDQEQAIRDMRDVVDISFRISKVVEISRDSNAASGVADRWRELLVMVQNAGSVPEILGIVSEFDASINELRERRSPLTSLRFEYESMRAKAELQADYDNLEKINTALRVIDTAERMRDGDPSVSRIDRIEVLLSWASESAPGIRAELDAYIKDAYRVRAGDILARAKSIENLADLGLLNNRFLPGYEDFVDSIKAKLDTARNLVIGDELARADRMVGEIFDEWQTVSGAYAENPTGSSNGYSLDELKRIEFRGQLDDMNEAVLNFHNPDFVPHQDEYYDMRSDAHDLIERGNFVDAESKIAEIGNFLKDHLALGHDRVRYEISYEHDYWILAGHLDKTARERQDLHLTIYDQDVNARGELEFTDTRDGNFYTRWNAPTEPGLYIVMLEWEDARASQLVYVPEETEYEYGGADLDIVELARELEELEAFIEKFGRGDGRLGITIAKIEAALNSDDAQLAEQGIRELQDAIERYLPERSRYAVIHAEYDDDQLVVSGAVQKFVEFSEDLFVDVFDQRGGHVTGMAMRDSPSGQFGQTVPIPLEPGTYVAQLEYHEFTVNDFFTVR